MTHIFKLLTGLTLSVMLTGCTYTPVRPADELSEQAEIRIIQEPRNDLSELMHYYDSLQDKSRMELLEEYKYVNSHHQESTDIQQRLKLLILLLLPNTSFQSNRVALSLVENLPEQIETTPDTIAFKNLLVLLLKRQRAANLQIQSLSEKLRAAEAEVKTLRNKINAIKIIEKDLMRNNTR